MIGRRGHFSGVWRRLAAQVRWLFAVRPGSVSFSNEKLRCHTLRRGDRRVRKMPKTLILQVLPEFVLTFFCFDTLTCHLHAISPDTRASAPCGPPTRTAGTSSVAENAIQPVSCNCS